MYKVVIHTGKDLDVVRLEKTGGLKIGEVFSYKDGEVFFQSESIDDVPFIDLNDIREIEQVMSNAEDGRLMEDTFPKTINAVKIKGEEIVCVQENPEKFSVFQGANLIGAFEFESELNELFFKQSDDWSYDMNEMPAVMDLFVEAKKEISKPSKK